MGHRLGLPPPSSLSYLNEDQDGCLPFSLLLALQAGQQVADNGLDLFAVILHHGPGGRAWFCGHCPRIDLLPPPRLARLGSQVHPNVME